MTPEEMKAIAEAKAKEEAQKQEEANKKLTQSQIQEQIDKLTKLVEGQSLESRNKQSQKEQDAADVEAVRLKQEADIRSMLSGDDKNVDYDDLSNKEVLDIVANAFDTAIDAKTQIASAEIVKPIEDLTKKIDTIQDYLIKKEAAVGVVDARKKFKDFDDYKEDISAIFEKYPGITVIDAYILAKGNKIGDEPPQHEMGSERPINLATRAEAAQKRFDDGQKKQADGTTSNEPNINTRRSFKNLLANAAEKILQTKKQQDY